MKNLIFGLAIIGLIMGCDKPDPEAAKNERKLPSAEEIKKMEKAAPDHPTVKPDQKRKLLVFSISWGYKHSAIPWGVETLKIMAEKSKAFDVVVSNDIAMFESENLEQFDGVVFNNTNNEIFLPENFKDLSSEQQEKAKKIDSRLKENFVNFLKSGKGLAVIHAGLASFREWPEFGEIIGARFDNHPWNSGSTISVKVDDPTHPINKAFSTPYFRVTDEIYQVKANYSRDNLRILLSIDTERTDMTKETIHRTDGDFALSWIKSYGDGRVFYFAFGHDHHIFWEPALLQHLQDGLQFVLGDLKADTTPSAYIIDN
jgi:type 1 glutamine amidotransferase